MRYMRGYVKQRYWQCGAMPEGLSASPRVFGVPRG